MKTFFKRLMSSTNATQETRSQTTSQALTDNGTRVMKPPFNETGSIVMINAKLLYSCVLGFAAWWAWPDDPRWWGFYILSVLSGAGGAALAIEAIKSAFKLRAAKIRWELIQAMGNRPKNAKLADKADLQAKGMN